MADMCPVCGETDFGLGYCPACDHPYLRDDVSDADDEDLDEALDEDDDDDEDDD